MKKSSINKIFSFLFVSFFVAAGFGMFTETAFANPHVAPSGEPYPLKTILEQELLLPAGTLLYDVPELDDGLYKNTYEGTPPVAKYEYDYEVDPEQVRKIKANIVGDGVVSSSLQKYLSSEQAWQMANDDCTNYSLIGCRIPAASNEEGAMIIEAKLEKASFDLESAREALSKAVPIARERQQGLINTFVKENAANALYAETWNNVTAGEETANSAIANQEGVDIGQAQEHTVSSALSSQPSAAEQEAIRAQRQDLVDQLNNDTLAMRMQDECSLGFPKVLGGSGGAIKILPCIANIVYTVVYKPTMYLLIGSGMIFDKMLDLSIDSKFVNQPFIDSAWGTIRDFSNMLFIFILLYTGIMTIFGAADWRKVVLQVVFIALIINFSLFFTKVVIDAGNILAVGVRSAIASGASISEGIAAGFQPQKFASLATQGDSSGADAIIVFIISAIITGFAAYIFFKAAILFVRRLVVFWALMIISPIAFISTAVPGQSSVFSKWINTLISQTFVAPVFLFFIYIIMKAISANGGILSYTGFAQVGEGWFNALIAPAIIAMLIIKALQEALKFAENMAGTAGDTVSGLVSGAIGLAAGAATGGASTLVGMAGRKFVGGAAANLLRGNNLQEGGMAQKAAQWATRASFDVRNAPVPKFASNAVGGAVKSLGLNVNVGKGAGVGGVEKAEQERIKEELKAVESQKVNIFQEQGMRNKAQEDERAAIKKGNIETSKIAFQAKETTKAVEQAQKEVDAAQKTVNDSPTAGAVASAKANYEEAVRNRMRGGTQEAVEAAKDVLEKAETSHTGVTSSAGLQATLSKLEAAKKAEKDALAALEKAEKEATDETKIAEKVSAAAKKATEEAVKEIEKVRRNKYVAGLEDKGRYTTADKVRKEAAKKKPVDEMKELLKKMAKEDADAEKAKEEKPAEEKKAEETK